MKSSPLPFRRLGLAALAGFAFATAAPAQMPGGKPVPAVTAEQMREVDRIMIEDLGITLIQMMENAGRALAMVSRDQLGGTAAGRRVLVLAGRGNNGGGGLAAARRMAGWGSQVTVVITDAAERFSGVPQHQLKSLQAMGVTVQVAPVARLPEADVIIDALLGYGLVGAPREPYATLIRQANAHGAPIVANDTPSGLDTTSGQAHHPCIRATVTVTLAMPKTGLMAPEAVPWVGELEVADISVPASVYKRLGLDADGLFSKRDIVRVRAPAGLAR